jgi:hypothetical protein
MLDDGRLQFTESFMMDFKTVGCVIQKLCVV